VATVGDPLPGSILGEFLEPRRQATFTHSLFPFPIAELISAAVGEDIHVFCRQESNILTA